MIKEIPKTNENPNKNLNFNFKPFSPSKLPIPGLGNFNIFSDLMYYSAYLVLSLLFYIFLPLK